MLTANYRRFPEWFIIICCLFILALLLTNCSCEFHQRKAIKKCGSNSITDTLIVRDTIYTKEVIKDTIFKHNTVRDTLVLSKENLVVKYFYNTHDSTVYLSGECKSDTIYIEKKVPYEKTIFEYNYIKGFFSKYWFIYLLIISLIVLYLIKK